MSEELDFSDLTDDQLVGLASALAREALHRQPAVAAALRAGLLAEQERAEATLRGAQSIKSAQLREAQERGHRAAVEQARELARQQRQQALAGALRRGAELAGRSPRDVTLIWTGVQAGGAYTPRLFLNPGATGSGSEIGPHLVDYCQASERMRVGWALNSQKEALLAWARETAATIRALGMSSVNIKGIEL